jgi:hypothetical protein
VELFPPADLRGSTEKTGAYLRGGFAEMAAHAGRLATVGNVRACPNCEHVLAAQIGALRTMDFRRVRDEDLRLFGLTVRAGQEWVLRAAADKRARDLLSSGLLGLVSLNRRREILNGLEAKDWGSVWQNLSLSDLCFLGCRYLERYDRDAWPSPVFAALRREWKVRGEKGLLMLGAPAPALGLCSHSHLAERAPYEEFENQFFPDGIAERVAEFNLYLGEFLNSHALPAGTFGVVAEPLARGILTKAAMADMRDWRAVLEGMARLDTDLLEDVLP